jgi:hypothetical protein
MAPRGAQQKEEAVVDPWTITGDEYRKWRSTCTSGRERREDTDRLDIHLKAAFDKHELPDYTFYLAQAHRWTSLHTIAVGLASDTTCPLLSELADWLAAGDWYSLTIALYLEIDNLPVDLNFSFQKTADCTLAATDFLFLHDGK